jgi:hypothetical protein
MRTYTLRAQNGAVTIAELDNLLPGPYYALRSNRIPGYAATLDGVHIASQLSTGQSASARFVLANRGGSAITLRRISAIVYGPNALQQGVGGATMIFPEVNDIVLQPGELYEYNQVHTMTAAGSYLALPRFEVNGALSLPLEPAFFQVRAAP